MEERAVPSSYKNFKEGGHANKRHDKRTILRFVISYGSFNIARDSLRQALALRLNPAPGNHSGTYCTFGMDCQCRGLF
jgi:hypothetical protein